MRLKYQSREGNFNFCNPSEVSINCHIGVVDNGKIIKSVNIKTDYEADGNDIDEAIDLLKEADKRVFYATAQKEWKEMIEFLENNREELEKGYKQSRILEIKDNISKLEAELEKLKN